MCLIYRIFLDFSTSVLEPRVNVYAYNYVISVIWNFDYSIKIVQNSNVKI